MKIKIFSFSAVLLLVGITSNAQSGYLKAGLNLANVSITENGRVDKANQLTSFNVGVMGDFKLGTSLLSLQPGILLSGKGSKVEEGTSGQAGYYKQTFNPMYIEVPFNLVVRVPVSKTGRFFVGAGPYLGIGVAGKVKTEGTGLLGSYNFDKSIEYADDDPTTLNREEEAGFYKIKRFDYGLNGTVGLEGKNLLFGINYGLGLAKLQSGTNNNADNNNKNRVLSFSIGFKF